LGLAGAEPPYQTPSIGFLLISVVNFYYIINKLIILVFNPH
jgi:hypothetical protein